MNLSRRGFFGLAAGAAVGVAVAKTVAAEATAPVSQIIEFSSPRLAMSRYEWASWSDGFGVDQPADLAALLRENMQCLKQGFEENFDLMLARRG